MNTKDGPPPPDTHSSGNNQNSGNNNGRNNKDNNSYKTYRKHQELQSSQENRNKTLQINECSTGYHKNSTENSDYNHSSVPPGSDPPGDSGSDPAPGSAGSGLSQTQQQFVLRFCRQLASVIEACEQSESAEIEVGRRHINACQVKVKLQAEREFTSQSRRANGRS